MHSAMKNAPNSDVTAQRYTETETSHTLLGGNSYSRIIRRSGTGVAFQLWPLMPNQVKPDREKQGQKRLVFVVSESGASDKTYTVEYGKPHDILHIKGLGWDDIQGLGLVHMQRNAIGSALALERNLGLFWAKGGRLPYVLKMKNRFKDQTEADQWRDNWNKAYSDPHNAPILDGEKEYQQTGLSMKDSMLIEARQQAVLDICRGANVSPVMIHDLSRSTFNNMEQLALNFIKLTLQPWLERWENEFWRCVLTPEEQSAGYFLRHNLRELLRGDFRTRMEGYATALQNGLWSIDEARDDDDKDPLPDGAGTHHHIQLNMGTLSNSGDVQEPGGAAPQKGLVRIA
jgi:HK97 family phage portal protein